MSATPWVISGTEGIVYSPTAPSSSTWNPSNILQYPIPIVYSQSDSWQFNPTFHVYNIQHDGGSGDVLQIELPIQSSLYGESAIWFFWLGEGEEGTILRFAALADDSSVNGVAGPGATYSYTNDGGKHLFIVIGVSGNYIVRSISAPAFQVTAGTGTTVTSDVQPYTFSVNAFVGSSVSLAGTTAASTAPFYIGTLNESAVAADVCPWIATRRGWVNQLYIWTTTDLAVPSNTLTATMQMNGVDLPIQAIILNGHHSGSALATACQIQPGDRITIKTVQTATGEAVDFVAAFSFRPDTL